MGDAGAQAPGDLARPDGGVPRDFGDVVPLRDRPPHGLTRVHAIERVIERWAIPRVAIEGALQLVENAIHFCHV
jgi:hypothetical protein